MEVVIGEKLNSFAHEYKVHNKIGEGSFSEVLKCQDKHSGICIAAKYLKKSFKSANHASELPEMIALRQLARHPNILHMIESHYESSTGRVIFIFELMDMSLYDMMKNRKRPIPESKAKIYLYQIVKGVAHIHHHGIFHRDIKPENILMKGELLKISDLGSVKGIYTRHPYTEYISTRWYRSPECLLTTGYYGPKMDVWAIGCVFFELLALKPLFPGSSELDQVSRINAVLGTPNPRLMAKFRKNNGRNISICFPPKKGSGLNQLIPFISEGGREVMKQMIIYDPESRSNIRRLVEHKYFQDVREPYMKLTKIFISKTTTVTTTQKYRNPALLSFLTTERKRKIKRKLTSTNKPIKASVTGKITDAKRNVLLQQSLQLKHQQLQQKEQSQQQVEKAVKENVSQLSLVSSKKIDSVDEIKGEKYQKIDVGNLLNSGQNLAKLKARLNAHNQDTKWSVGIGAGEGEHPKRVQLAPQRKFTLKISQQKQQRIPGRSKLSPIPGAQTVYRISSRAKK